MYLDFKVAMPKTKGVSVKRIKNIPYVYLEYGRVYLPEKKYNTAKRVCIGKACDDQPGMMIPNTNFVKYFPEEAFPKGAEEVVRSSCIHVGAFLVIRKIIEEKFPERMITEVVGREAGLFLELAVYSLLTEGNTAQYYQDYAYNHPLLTEKMKIYSDSEIFDFLTSISKNQRLTFLNEWNTKNNHGGRIYIACDSIINRHQSDEVDIAEAVHTKDEGEKTVINYLIAYDADSREPLFYDTYYGRMSAARQIRFMLDKAGEYGCQQVGFVLNHTYFSEENIQLLDQSGCDFIVMVKGEEKLVRDVVWETMETFEQDCVNSIPAYQVSGTTVKRRLFPTDRQERYFHIYYNEQEHMAERDKMKDKIDRMSEQLKAWSGKRLRPTGEFQKYFKLLYFHEGQEDEVFNCGRELTEVIHQEIKLYGYFVIITSEKMTAEEALTLCIRGNESQKLFCGNKPYLQDGSERIYGHKSVDAKIFIEFAALIIRNQIDVCIRERLMQNGRKWNGVNVSSVLRELEKIEMIKGLDNVYRLDHDVTAAQREILNAFGMTDQDIKVQAKQLSKELIQVEQEKADNYISGEGKDVKSNK